MSVKIYYVANARMPTEKAHGIQIAKMCEALIEAGADVELIVPRRRADPRSIREFYDLRREIPVVKLPVWDLYKHGELGFLIGSFSFMLSYLFYFLFKSIGEENAIVYTTDLDQFSFFFIPFLGFPYFAEIHGAKRKGFFYALFFRSMRGVITINGMIRDALMKEFHFRPDQVIVHPNGIDLTVFNAKVSQGEARAALHLPPDEKIVLYAGKYYPWKGMEILMRPDFRLRKGARLYVVGVETEELRYDSRKDMPSAEFVMAGQRPYAEIPLWLAAADVLLVLGTRQNEYSYLQTSPMKLFEYMASGRPIVASSTPANREIIAESEAVFYEPDNPRDLAEKINYVLAHPDEHMRRVENAQKKVRVFSWDRRARSVIQFMSARI